MFRLYKAYLDFLEVLFYIIHISFQGIDAVEDIEIDYGTTNQVSKLLLSIYTQGNRRVVVEIKISIKYSYKCHPGACNPLKKSKVEI